MQPLLEILEHLVPDELFESACRVCEGKGWYFGHGSHDSHGVRFWKMDLDGVEAFDSIWNHVRPRCEELAGTRLAVVRQYANGHTYGLGGDAHVDDDQPGTFTLLFYPMREWRDGWNGETVFFDEQGEVALAVRPRPNRAVLFDSRILHSGRAPDRNCPALRVTVAYKLKAITEEKEEGASRTITVSLTSTHFQKLLDDEFTRLNEAIRLPGFRPGKIPRNVLEQRYGQKAGQSAIQKIVSEKMDELRRSGHLPSAVEVLPNEIHITSTHLPSLPDLDVSALKVEKLTVDEALLTPETQAVLRAHWKQQILDQLAAIYDFPIAAPLIEREFSAIWAAAQAEAAIPEDQVDLVQAELRTIAERRVRLGVLVAELARRLGIREQRGEVAEDRVVEALALKAQTSTRRISPEELQALVGD